MNGGRIKSRHVALNQPADEEGGGQEKGEGEKLVECKSLGPLLGATCSGELPGSLLSLMQHQDQSEPPWQDSQCKH